jgi:uncharacterized DUF497 family protein
MYFKPADMPTHEHEFEFDDYKSAVNKEKHGINFDEAQRLWLDESRVEVPARFDDEARSLVVGKIGDDHLAAVITYRGEKTRIISVKRARPEEIEIYEG